MTVKENEFGDKISKSDICAGVMFWLLGVGALSVCLIGRGCQELNKHRRQPTDKPKVIQIQNNYQR